VIDQELRWAIVKRLMVLGADPGLIEAELARDTTTSGHDHAAGAKASIGTIEAKRAALEAVLHSTARAYEIYAIAERLFLTEQAELCEPLVPEWCAGIAGTAAIREGWALSKVIELSFPLAITTPATLEAVQQIDTTDERIAKPLRAGADALSRCLAQVALLS
jgi:aminopeptidase N